MYNTYKKTNLQEISLVKVKRSDFEALAKENGLLNFTDFYKSDYFNNNFTFAKEVQQGEEVVFITKEI
jgi:hypothetical protein